MRRSKFKDEEIIAAQAALDAAIRGHVLGRVELVETFEKHEKG